MAHVVNKAELAEVLGISLPTVGQWVKEGLPAVSRGGNGRAWEFDLAECVAWVRKRDVARATEVSDTSTMAEAELRHRRAQAAIQEIELAERRRQVVRVEDVSTMVADLVTSIRQRLRSTGGRLAPKLVGVEDGQQIRAAIDEEIDTALRDLAEYEPEEESEAAA